MSELILEYEYDESFFDKRLPQDDFGLLRFTVRTVDFSGAGADWVQWQDVLRLGEKLDVFPITSPIEEAWGSSLGIVLGFSIEPVNATGDLRVWVEIGDKYEMSRRVRTSFLTNYPDVEAFRRGIVQLMGRRAEQATLRGR